VDAAMKEALLRRMRLYLDQVEVPEQTDAAVAGLAEENPEAPDLFSLLSELAALKNEVKLEARQVKGALDEFRGVFEALETANRRAEQEQQRRREQARALRAREYQDLLLGLLDLRDRLQAGQGAAADYRPKGLFGRRQARELAASMAEGLAMNLRRLDEILARRGVQPVPALGRLFDPRQMHAAELASDPQRRLGEVLAERRPGFLLDGALLRPAEVIVNRPDLGTATPSSPTKDSA
jgi:molecular chaperone GrpE